MTDNNPKKFLTKTCDSKGAAGQTNKSNFFRSLGKIGDIEALNHVDGNIGQGLRALETISNQIRTGGGAPNVFTDALISIENGANTVLDIVGINPNTARDLGERFNPGVLNKAVGQAETIYDRVRQGNFEIRDVPEAIQDFGNLSQLLGGIFTPKQNRPTGKDDPGKCPPSPYAVDLINLAPKHKFMFVVEFVFTLPYVEQFTEQGVKDFAFVIKRSTRPNMTFEYEDINFYNFRTKVLKKSEYQPMTMTFYDDMTDNVLRFYTRYMQIISPISRSVGDGTSTMFEESGMSFAQATRAADGSIIQNGVNSASINAVGDTTKTIIDYVNLYHIIHAGRQVDVYRFDNPRIQTMTLDDLDMADGSAGSEVTIEFNFDGLNIMPGQDLRDFVNIQESTSVGMYPIIPRFGGDAPSTTKDTDTVPSTSKTELEQTSINSARDVLNENTANLTSGLVPPNT